MDWDVGESGDGVTGVLGVRRSEPLKSDRRGLGIDIDSRFRECDVSEAGVISTLGALLGGCGAGSGSTGDPWYSKYGGASPRVSSPSVASVVINSSIGPPGDAPVAFESRPVPLPALS